MYEKIMCYVRTFKPKYEYDMSDFIIYDHLGTITLDWKFKNIPKPSLEDLEKVSPEVLTKFRKRKEVKCRMTIVDDLEDIENPKNGDMVILSSETDHVLYVYIKDSWKII